MMINVSHISDRSHDILKNTSPPPFLKRKKKEEKTKTVVAEK